MVSSFFLLCLIEVCDKEILSTHICLLFILRGYQRCSNRLREMVCSMVFVFVVGFLLFLICYLLMIVFSFFEQMMWSVTLLSVSLTVIRLLQVKLLIFKNQLSSLAQIVLGIGGFISSILGVSQALYHGHYLGLPSLISRSKKCVFYFLNDRLLRRVSCWNSKFLSQDGKEILLKSVAQAIPSYVMSVFALLISLCEELERMMNSFQQGSNGRDSKKIHWLSWHRICFSKDKGGLDFWHLRYFNLAIVSKQGWSFISNPESLPVCILKAKYFPEVDFLNATEVSNPIFIWKYFAN